MNILEFLLSVVAPHDCLGCGQEGSLLCPPCSSRLPAISSRCYRCLVPKENYKTCINCSKESCLGHVWVASAYQKDASKLVRALKFDRAKAGAELIASIIANNCALPGGVVIVPVRTVSRRRRQRGYDQAVLIAKELSKLTALPYINVLTRDGDARQVGATRTKRIKQLQGAYMVTSPGRIRGKSVLLVDDVITTGATLESAAKAIMQAGAASVDAVVFAAA